MAVKPKKRATSSTAKTTKSTKNKKPKAAKLLKSTKTKTTKAAALKKKAIAKKGAKKVVKKSPTKSSKKKLASPKKITPAKKTKKTIAKTGKSTKVKTSAVHKGAKKATTAKTKKTKTATQKPKALIASKAPAKGKFPPKMVKAAKSTQPKVAKPKKLAIVEFSGKKIEIKKRKESSAQKSIEGEEQKTAAQVSSLVGMDIPPYQENAGEEYMNERQHEHFRKILYKWKSQLLEEMDRTMHHLQDEAANFPDPNDRATQEEEFSLELRARDRERKLIKKIEEALQKIDADEYGYCDSCGVEIGIRRLEARPTANLCIDCKTLDEIRERQLWG